MSYFEENFPAQFNWKLLVSPSSCKLHPNYQGRRLPTSTKEGCTCRDIYYAVKGLKYGYPIAVLSVMKKLKYIE